MSFHIPDSNYEFLFETQEAKSESSNDQLLAWALRCFQCPESERRLLQLHLSLTAQQALEMESALYLDRHTRDAELGRQLIEPHWLKWEELVKQVREVVAREQRQISIARARYETMKRVNAIERNEALRYPRQAIEDAAAEVARIQSTVSTRPLLVPALSLERLLQLSSDTESISSTSSYDCEQALRMLSQGTKGYLKVFALSERFPLRTRLHHTIGLGPNQSQVTVGVTVPLEHWPAQDRKKITAVLSIEVSSYLFYQLKAAFSLCAEATAQWGALRQLYQEELGWPLLFKALRSILDLYHFCAFEIPFGLTDVVIDRNDTNKVLGYSSLNNSWQPIDERGWIDKPLKRWIAESIVLMHAGNRLLNDNGELVVNLIEILANQHPLVFMPGNFQPYLSIGLTNLPAQGAISAQGLADVWAISNAVLTEVVRAEQDEFPIQAEDIGQWLAAAMALDSSVFPVSSDQPAIGETERAFLLTHFWHEMGHWRAAELLGLDYIELLTTYREQLSANNSDEVNEGDIFDNIDLQAIEAEPAVTYEHDLLQPFTSQEQDQLLNSINLAWKIIKPSLIRLMSVSQQGRLDEIVHEFLWALQTQGTALTDYFPENWIISSQVNWSLLRLQAPTACDLLNQFHETQSREQLLASVRWQYMLAALLRLAGDLTRLKLLIETCSPLFRPRVEEAAEPSARLFLQASLACHRYVHTQSLEDVPALDEIIFSYFSEDHFHNAWFAFIDRCINELEQFLNLRSTEVGAREFCDLITQALIEMQRSKPHQE
ncbi:MAG: hypothetical protein AB1489_32225 [Acidobacteriota bacterium]